jgi:hypothetical protein
VPQDVEPAKVLLVVKTYPLPSSKYGELVCTAGLLEGGGWVRIYPIHLSVLTDDVRLPKYSWVELDLVRNTGDFRPESYRPRMGLDEPVNTAGWIGTADNWAARKSIVLHEVFRSMEQLIELAHGPSNRSLATVRPAEVTGFAAQPVERDWKEKWLAQSKQGTLLEIGSESQARGRPVIRKLPYDYFYEFRTEGDDRPRRMRIEDWEIGALFWNCLKRTGNEQEANRLVRERYFDDFVANKDLHLFVGTTKRFHNIAPNPFTIVGVFYPPKTPQMQLL